MDLEAVTTGAFHDNQISALLNLPEGKKPLYVIPAGKQ